MLTYAVDKEAPVEKQQDDDRLHEKEEKTLDETLASDAVVDDDLSIKIDDASEDTELIKIPHNRVAYADSLAASSQSYHGSEEFYDKKQPSKKYYESFMKPDDEKQIITPQADAHEQKVEQEAQSVQNNARDSNEYGLSFLTDDGLTRYEQTGCIAATAVNTEARRMFSLLHPGWWKCLYDAKSMVSSELN